MRIEGADRLAAEMDRWKASADDINAVVDRGLIIGAIADEAKTQIRKRTTAGRDYMEQPFTPYAPRTVEHRRKLGLQTGHVDLSETGAMRANLSKRVLNPRLAELYEAPGVGKGGGTPRDIVARAHNWGVPEHNLPRRLWLALGTFLIAKLEDLAYSLLARAIRETFIQGRRASIPQASGAAAAERT